VRVCVLTLVCRPNCNTFMLHCAHRHTSPATATGMCLETLSPTSSRLKHCPIPACCVRWWMLGVVWIAAPHRSCTSPRLMATPTPTQHPKTTRLHVPAYAVCTWTPLPAHAVCARDPCAPPVCTPCPTPYHAHRSWACRATVSCSHPTTHRRWEEAVCWVPEGVG
jgi:hypothetical protein